MRFIPAVLLFGFGCGEARYFCAPGTHIEGEWCVADEISDTGGSGNPDSADTDSAGSETGDSAGDTGDSGDSDSQADTDSAEPLPERVVINEFMASNDTKAADEFGEFDDWIELYNAGEQTASLADCSLTDDPEQLALYMFPPDTTLAPGQWLVVWADGTPEQGSFHAGFTLSSAADRFFLVRDPAGAADVLDSVEFTDLATEVAAARTPDGAKDWWVTENVTPGAANAAP